MVLDLALVFVLLFLLGCFFWSLYSVLTSPEGWEDEDGFHEGTRPPG